MKKLLLCFFLAVTQHLWATDIFNTPVSFVAGSSLNISTGIQLQGTWDFTLAPATVILPTSAIPNITLTGNATGTGPFSNVPVTINTIPDLVSEPGSILFTNVASPIAPASGFIKAYADSTDKRLHDRNDAGTTGTTVVANAGSPNNFMTAVSTAGVFTLAQPSFSNLSGTISTAQEGRSYTFPASIGATDYTLISNGTNAVFYPTGIIASSTTTAASTYATDTYVIGTAIPVSLGDFKVQGRYHFLFDMTKTAAGVATPIITVRVGTTAGISDPAVATLTFSAGTAAADSGTFEGWVIIRQSGATTKLAVVAQCVHQGGTTGLVSKNSDYVNVTPAAFDSTSSSKIGVSFNGGTSFSGTNVVASADLAQP